MVNDFPPPQVIQTEGFTCIEMRENRPWTYQTDLYCVAATVHVMLFGEYMQVSKKFGGWEIKQKLPRYVLECKTSLAQQWTITAHLHPQQILEEERVDRLFQQTAEYSRLR